MCVAQLFLTYFCVCTYIIKYASSMRMFPSFYQMLTNHNERLFSILYQLDTVLECEQFTYVLVCNQACGNCSKGEQCHHVNGSCLNGCEVGMYGDKCDNSEL